MSINSLHLADAFAAYLSSHRREEEALRLSQALECAQFHTEATALRFFFRPGQGSCRCAHERYTDLPCSVGVLPPSDANPGHMWFDVLELTWSVLVPNQEDVSVDSVGWLAIEPIKTWQFRAFLRLCKVSGLVTDFPFPAEYLREERFLLGETYVGNVYHDEAMAYAHWFGKGLVNQIDLQNAESYLNTAQMDRVLPRKMAVWDSSVDVEDLRLAIARETLHESPAMEVQRFFQGTPMHRMVFGEWECRHDIGASTILLRALVDPQRRGGNTMYVKLANSAYSV
jgi:hypothetical protein